MQTTDKATRFVEKGISTAILLTLAVIAAAMLVVQRTFHPAVLVATSAAPLSAGPATGEQSVPSLVHSSLESLSSAESFTSDNLYDKINGKAELYLAAGFSRMRCQRYALKDDPDQWLEWFEYQMQGVPQAFSVFSTQRRPEGEPLEFTEHAYRTPNALFFASGSNYVEVIASTTNAPLMDAALQMAVNNATARSDDAAGLVEMKLLPAEHLIPGSHSMQISDAFGFDQFKNVYTASYRINDADITAFVTSTPGARQAEALRDAYESFLIANGGKKLAAETSPGKAVEIMGTVEIVFSHGPIVAGVHSAPDRAVAEQLARLLKASLEAQ